MEDVDAPIPEERFKLQVAPSVVGNRDQAPKEPTAADQVVHRLQRRTGRLVELVSNFTLTRPEMLRSTSAHRVLSRVGLALREGPYLQDWYHHSKQTTKIDQFWTHSWHGNVWHKIALLFVMCNAAPAAVCGSLVAVATSVLLVWMGFATHSWVFLPGLLSSGLVLLMWRPSRSVFLDKICIQQNDPQLMAEGAVNVGATVKNSTTMLICWDPTYTERLWCLLEVAAFLRTHENAEKHLAVRPTSWGPAVIFMFLICGMWGFLENYLVFLIAEPEWSLEPDKYLANIMLYNVADAFVHVPLGMCVAHFWRGHMRSLETACNQLSAFSFERDVKCHCCSISHIHPMTGRRMLCDHETMRECLCIWFGSVAEFEKIMRDRVSAVFKESFRRCALPYRWIVGSTVPRSWSYIFILFQTAYAEDYAGTAAMCFISLGGLLSLTPLLLWLELRLAHCLRHRRDRMWKELLIDLVLACAGWSAQTICVVVDTLLFLALGNFWVPGMILHSIASLAALAVFCR